MSSNAKIKVIRKKDVSVKGQGGESSGDEGRKTARKMVTNVSSWVKDFQKRKRDETKEAIDKLFPVKPQADSA